MSGREHSQLVSIIICICFVILFYAKKSQAQSWMNPPFCKPSSCGKITNITYPFRLSSDTQGCGYLELVCEHNATTFFYLDSVTKYRVEEIEYKPYILRVVDAGLIADNYSSMPLYSSFSATEKNGYPYYTRGSDVVLFLNCDEPVNSTIYLDIGGRVKGQYSYVLMGGVKVMDVANSCTLEKVIPIMPRDKPGVEDAQNYSYKDVHNAMAYGFELQFPYEYGYGIKFFEIMHAIFNDLLTLGFFLPYVEYKWLKISFMLAGVALYWVVGLRLCMFPCVCLLMIIKRKRMRSREFDNIESFLENHNDLMPIRYSYSDIRRMTEGFNEKLGEGGYGSVFKGKLKSGRIVAVKLLNRPKANGQEFINEVATIGTIHHFNIVRLVGYCAERYKRALVYDYMPNGSLEKYVFSKQGAFSLSREKMYEISLGVARGIEYLHKGCTMQILHFDIKPHNILLDENFTPKVSDFGLAKLYPTDDSIVSLTAARGTMGYMAPELFYKNIGGVSYKADVYSFGMLLMEMAGRRRNVDPFAENITRIYFPSWVYDQLNEGIEIEMEDATTISEEERKMVSKMIVVALWCIQMKPSDRPSMSKVVEMLEGSFEQLVMPPKPEVLATSSGDN